MIKNVAIAGLLVIVGILGNALVNVENERYARQVGMCGADKGALSVDAKCLERVQTRTAWWWHVFYGVWH